MIKAVVYTLAVLALLAGLSTTALGVPLTCSQTYTDKVAGDHLTLQAPAGSYTWGWTIYDETHLTFVSPTDYTLSDGNAINGYRVLDWNIPAKIDATTYAITLTVSDRSLGTCRDICVVKFVVPALNLPPTCPIQPDIMCDDPASADPRVDHTYDYLGPTNGLILTYKSYPDGQESNVIETFTADPATFHFTSAILYPIGNYRAKLEIRNSNNPTGPAIVDCSALIQIIAKPTATIQSV